MKRTRKQQPYTSKSYRLWIRYLNDKYFPDPFGDALTIDLNSEGYCRKLLRALRNQPPTEPSPRMQDYLQRTAAYKAEVEPYNRKTDYSRRVPADWNPNGFWSRILMQIRYEQARAKNASTADDPLWNGNPPC